MRSILKKSADDKNYGKFPSMQRVLLLSTTLEDNKTGSIQAMLCKIQRLLKESPVDCRELLNFLVTVKAAPHECVNRTGLL